MKSCRECVHMKLILRASENGHLSYCGYPMPGWYRPKGSYYLLQGDDTAVDCPTYQPREERETQP